MPDTDLIAAVRTLLYRLDSFWNSKESKAVPDPVKREISKAEHEVWRLVKNEKTKK